MKYKLICFFGIQKEFEKGVHGLDGENKAPRAAGPAGAVGFKFS